jgi:branched-chain amino acid transport system ATP-binding protein
MLLEIEGLDAGYRNQPVLNGVSIHLSEREVVLLIGPNGAGKSTVLKCVSGLLPAWRGVIRFNGENLNKASPSTNVARGITMSPQGTNVFSDMTVADNLRLGGYQLSDGKLPSRIDEVLEIFPLLKTRLRQVAGTLSGGEQQMLSVARAMVPKPRLLLLDEPTLGLGPQVVERVFESIGAVLEKANVAILMVEHRTREALKVCDRVYAMKLGSISFEGAPEDLISDGVRLRQLFL